MNSTSQFSIDSYFQAVYDFLTGTLKIFFEMNFSGEGCIKINLRQTTSSEISVTFPGQNYSHLHLLFFLPQSLK